VEKNIKSYFYIQLDFLCDMGYTSRLISALKTANLNPRQVNLDFVRVYYRIEPDRLLESSSDLCKLLEKYANFWRELCIEMWIEKFVGKIPVLRIRSDSVIKIGNILVYVKPGSRGRVYYKFIWYSDVGLLGVGNITEGVTRFCIQGGDFRGLSTACKYLELFVQHYHSIVQDDLLPNSL